MRNRRVRSEREWPRLLAGPEPPPSTLSPFGLWRSLVSALDWGSRGREFKSPQPDKEGAGQRRGLRDAWRYTALDRANPGEMWNVASTGWVYVVRDADHAGHTVITLSVSDLDDALA